MLFHQRVVSIFHIYESSKVLDDFDKKVHIIFLQKFENIGNNKYCRVNLFVFLLLEYCIDFQEYQQHPVKIVYCIHIMKLDNIAQPYKMFHPHQNNRE